MPPPIESQVSRASVIIDGTVERVAYLRPDGTPETEPRKAEPPRDATLCGPKLITFKVGQRLKGEAGETLTVFAEDGCVGLGSYYRAGEGFVEFAYARTDSLRDTVMSRSTRFPGVAPADVKLYVHACGGTRRVRAADGTRGARRRTGRARALRGRDPAAGRPPRSRADRRRSPAYGRSA